MIAIDTNILARFYCDDPEDIEAKKQRVIARRVILESRSLYIPLSVVLELEWVMRGFYNLTPADFCQATEHLLGMSHITVERWEMLREAIDLHRSGFDFADALHWAASRHCDGMLTFDDRGFSRRANKIKLIPEVRVAI
jgi:predicted nucleic-acid-binding protein